MTPLTCGAVRTIPVRRRIEVPDVCSPGDIVDRYRIVRRIGDGGLGIVYEAVDMVLGRPVALKFMLPRHRRSLDERRRFKEEARFASHIAHTNVAALHSCGHSPAGPFLVMEYVPGMTLLDCMRSGPLTALDACRCLLQVAAGLAAFHKIGLVHRDIKPANLIVTPDGIVKIVDFGLTCRTGYRPPDGCRFMEGTPAFVSPEQVIGEAVDGRSDQYSLGATLYCLLTLDMPFTGQNGIDVALARLTDRPLLLTERLTNVPPCVVRLLERLMARSPDVRFPDDASVSTTFETIVACLQGSTAAFSPIGDCLAACHYRLCSVS